MRSVSPTYWDYFLTDSKQEREIEARKVCTMKVELSNDDLSVLITALKIAICQASRYVKNPDGSIELMEDILVEHMAAIHDKLEKLQLV